MIVGITDEMKIKRHFSMLIATPPPYTAPTPVYVIVSRRYPHDLSGLLEKDQMRMMFPYYLICGWFFQYQNPCIKKSRGGIGNFLKN
jgi:hypothetical protein